MQTSKKKAKFTKCVTEVLLTEVEQPKVLMFGDLSCGISNKCRQMERKCGGSSEQ